MAERHVTYPPTQNDRLAFLKPVSSHHPATLAEVVADGLSQSPKRLPCRFFYDSRGSHLFERISGLPEYYLTRTEQSILQDFAPEMIEAASEGTGKNISLIEFGSGSSCKTRILIEAALARQERVEYVPIDISTDFLLASSLGLLAEYNRLSITAIAAEYNDGIHAIPGHDQPRLILFLGSNIGNFEQADAVEFLTRVRRQMTEADRILVGVDMVKDTSLIEAAYNDCAGVTEEFNKNLLIRINEELGGQFNPDKFEHRAPFVARESRIEMWLMSRHEQSVAVRSLDREFSFAEGEGIHTENSHKYTPVSMEFICRAAGLEVQTYWSDPREWFGVMLLRPGGL